MVLWDLWGLQLSASLACWQDLALNKFSDFCCQLFFLQVKHK